MGRQEAGRNEAVGAIPGQRTGAGCESSSQGPGGEPGEPGRHEELRRRAVRLEYFTIGWNLIEAGVALGAGWLASSIALEGFGLDSVIEIIAGVTLLWRFKGKAIEEGHAEARAVRIVGATFFALAAYVGYEAAVDLWLHRAPRFSLPGMVLAFCALLVMPSLGLAKRRTARQLQSRALAAEGLESLLCAYLSATLLLGLGCHGLLGWWWADPVAALAMTPFMIREGIEATFH